MSDWTHPTLVDAGITGPVTCRCGRQRDATEMLEVRNLGVGTDYLCAACIEDLYRLGATDRLTFYERAGAPQDWLDAHDLKLRAGPLLRPGLSQEQWGEIMSRALDLAVAEGSLTPGEASARLPDAENEPPL